MDELSSILTSIKKMLGITKEYEIFDPDIIMHINTAFLNLHELGVGPEKGFLIEDDTAQWSDYVPDINSNYLSAIKTYIYLKVKLVFDPPTNGTVTESFNNMLRELEWRIVHYLEVSSKSATE